MASSEVIEQVRTQADIVDIIGEFVELKRRGRNFIGLCPFHTEKTPSFTVSQDKQLYKCFGCGKSGNVFSFVMDFNGMSFPESLEFVAKKINYELPHEKSRQSQEGQSHRENALKALQAASQFYTKLLSKPEGAAAWSYFNKRGFLSETVQKFALGYSPDSWDAATLELRRLGVTDEALSEAGLVIQREGSGFYDRFRGRAMFAIRDFLGRIVGFGARQMKDLPDQPKYINSPQTIVYDKSKVLYGLFEAKNAIRNEQNAILVEGYADTITLHQAGIENTIASSGTALTNDQLVLLSRYTKKLYIVYDADTAGVKAAERGLELALEKGFETLIVTLPAGEDPDSLVRKHGKNTFKLYLRDAKSFMDFRIENLKTAGKLNSPTGKADAIREMLRIIARIPDRLQHDFFISRLASLMDLSEQQVQKVYAEKGKIERELQPQKSEPIVVRPKDDKFVEPQLRDALSEPKEPEEANHLKRIIKNLLPEELHLLKTALNDPAAFGIMTDKYNVSKDTFVNEEGKKLFTIIESYSAGEDSILNLIVNSEHITSDDKEIFTGLALLDDSPSESWHKFGWMDEESDTNRSVRDAAYRLELKRIESERISIQNMLKKGVSQEEENFLLENIMLLDKRKFEIQEEAGYLKTL